MQISASTPAGAGLESWNASTNSLTSDKISRFIRGVDGWFVRSEIPLRIGVLPRLGRRENTFDLSEKLTLHQAPLLELDDDRRLLIFLSGSKKILPGAEPKILLKISSHSSFFTTFPQNLRQEISSRISPPLGQEKNCTDDTRSTLPMSEDFSKLLLINLRTPKDLIDDTSSIISSAAETFQLLHSSYSITKSFRYYH